MRYLALIALCICCWGAQADEAMPSGIVPMGAMARLDGTRGRFELLETTVE